MKNFLSRIFSAQIRISDLLLIILISLFFSLTFAINFSLKEHQQFSELSKAFLEGKLYFLEKPENDALDAVFFNNRYYWPLGPTPALILMPFLFLANILHFSFQESFLQPFLTVAIFYLCFRIAEKYNFSKIDSLWFALAFSFSSMFLGTAFIATAHLFSQVITVLFLLLSLFEYFHKKRYWLIGILLGLIVATRLTAGLSAIFFILAIISEPNQKQTQKAKNVLTLSIPILVTIIMLFFYNYLRFHNPLEHGYSLQILLFEPLINARNYGLMSLIHLPGNIFYAIFSMPLPIFKDGIPPVLKPPFVKANPWGLSIFLTSPYLIYLFFVRYKDRLSKLLLITIVAIAFPIFLYYGVGIYQFGYRYALDFMPFLFLLFLIKYSQNHKSISAKCKTLVSVSSFFNFYLFLTLYIK